MVHRAEPNRAGQYKPINWINIQTFSAWRPPLSIRPGQADGAVELNKNIYFLKLDRERERENEIN